MRSLQHVVAGARLASRSAEALPVVDPATGAVIASCPAGCAADVDAAVAAARAAAPVWASMPLDERGRLLCRAGERVAAAAPGLALWESREMGKPIAMATADIVGSAAGFEAYATLAGEHLADRDPGVSRVVRAPYGVAALVVPWNYPVCIAIDGLASLLAAGNTVVLKPSEKSPLSGVALMDALDHLPPGVVNLLLGDGRSGGPLVEHPGVDIVSFTGSVATGRRVGEACGRRLVPALLELGGKDAVVVDADVDPAWAATLVARGAFTNTGQVCTSIERVYVHEAIAAEFVRELVAMADSTRVGPPDAADTDLGPLVDARQRDVVDGHVRDAVAGGARVLVGGRVPDGPGWYYPPTVVVDVPDDATLMTDETFGPVAPVRVVASFAEALRLAASGTYGLGATVLTGDPAHATDASRLPAATVTVNDGGEWPADAEFEPARASGVGRVGTGRAMLDAVTRPTTVIVAPAPTRPRGPALPRTA